MTPQTEGQHPGEFILAEAGNQISRDEVTLTVATGAKLAPGLVLAQLAADEKFVPYDNTGSDGSEAAAGILYGDNADNTDGVAPADFQVTIVARIAAVRKDALQWASGVDAAGKTAAYADLAAQFIIAR